MPGLSADQWWQIGGFVVLAIALSYIIAAVMPPVEPDDPWPVDPPELRVIPVDDREADDA